MPKAFVVNTNKSKNRNAKIDMLQHEKCAAYYSPFKYFIDSFEADDIVFLYSNNVGIIARGIATGNVEMKDWQGKSNEKHYMQLHNFEVLKTLLTAADFTQIIREVAGDDNKVIWNQTMFLLAHKYGSAVWQHITKYCL